MYIYIHIYTCIWNALSADLQPAYGENVHIACVLSI